MSRVVFGISLPPEMLTALDAVVEQRRRTTWAQNISRSSIVREALVKHLADSETVAPNKKEKANA